MKLKNIILLISSSLILVSCGSDEQSKLFVPEIPVYKITAEDVPIYQEFVGQVYGLKDISIRARVEGFLEGIYFKEGSRLVKGAKLYTVESQPFEADVAAKMSRVAESKTRQVIKLYITSQLFFRGGLMVELFFKKKASQIGTPL